jgi:DNA-binding GntR family transcriptional regulator
MSIEAARERYPLSGANLAPVAEVKNKKTLVYELLKGRIIQNEYKPGFPINENVLCEELQISKTPVREAVQQLERDGFITTIPGRGSFVRHITVEDVREIFDTREIIECAVARRAAVFGNQDVLSQKRQEIISNLSTAEDNTEIDRDDVHVFIFKLLANQRLLGIYSHLLDHIKRLRVYFNVRFDVERARLYTAEHVEIIDSLILRDPDKAEQAVLIHLRNASTYITRLTSF